MNLETKITIYKFTPQLFTLTLELVKRGNVFFIVLYLDGVGHLMRCLIHD